MMNGSQAMRKVNLSGGYSAGERNLFALLSNNRRDRVKLTLPDGTEKKVRAVSTIDLVELHYGKNKPRFARQAVVDALKNLGRKLDDNREPVRLLKSNRSGPHAMQFWLEKR